MSINGKRVAIIVADGFESSEYAVPKKALEQAGATTTTLTITPGEVRGWQNKQWADAVNVPDSVADASPEEFDAVVLPGGTMSPDTLRQDSGVISFIRAMFDAGKPLAAICHGPWPLINAGIVDTLNVTSYPSLRHDLENAGAYWTDEPVVVDQGVITSRSPEDLPDFCAKLIEEIGEGRHFRESAAEAVIHRGSQ